MHVIINRYKRYVLKRQVQAIVVKVPPPKKRGRAITHILKRLEALAKKHGCSFDLITKNDMKNALGLHSTTALNECVRLLYPELGVIYQKSVSNDHSYYKKLFEAVLAAHIFQERLNSKAARQERTTE